MTNGTNGGQSGFAQALGKAIAHAGPEVLCGGRRLHSLVADFSANSPECRRSMNLLRYAIECGIPGRMYEAMGKDVPTQAIVIASSRKLLMEDYGIGEEAAGRLMEDFATALGWQRPKALPPAKPAKKPVKKQSQNPPAKPGVTGPSTPPAAVTPAPAVGPAPVVSPAPAVVSPAPAVSPAPGVATVTTGTTMKMPGLPDLSGVLWGLYLLCGGVLWVLVQLLLHRGLGKVPLDGRWWELLGYFLMGVGAYIPHWLALLVEEVFYWTGLADSDLGEGICLTFHFLGNPIPLLVLAVVGGFVFSWGILNTGVLCGSIVLLFILECVDFSALDLSPVLWWLGVAAGGVLWVLVQLLLYWGLGKVPVDGWWWGPLGYFLMGVGGYLPFWLLLVAEGVFSYTNLFDSEFGEGACGVFYVMAHPMPLLVVAAVVGFLLSWGILNTAILCGSIVLMGFLSSFFEGL